METSLHARVIAHLQAHKGRWPKVARESGVSKRTIEKIARQVSKNPRVKNLETLDRYFTQHSE